jgi:NADH-quinone oxidoreductase subunit J
VTEWAVFSVVAIAAIGMAVGLVVRPNPLHGALFLVGNLFCVAVLFLMLGAEFLALAQVIVYAGAIMVLFLFAIFVLIPGKEETGPDPHRAWRLLAVPLGGVFLLELALAVAVRGTASTPPVPPLAFQASMALLFTDYLFPFELTSVLLLAAMVGVLVLARRKA